MTETAKSAASRQAQFRYNMHRQGMREVTGWVREHQTADMTLLMRRLREDPDLEIGPLRNTRTGRLVKL